MKTIIEILVVVFIIVTLNVIASNFFIQELNYYNNTIDDIYRLIEAENYKKATDKIEVLTDRWHSTNSIWGALTNHQELDNIELLIHKLNNHYISYDKTLAIIDLIQLRVLIEHTANRYNLKLRNIF